MHSPPSDPSRTTTCCPAYAGAPLHRTRPLHRGPHRIRTRRIPHPRRHSATCSSNVPPTHKHRRQSLPLPDEIFLLVLKVVALKRDGLQPVRGARAINVALATEECLLALGDFPASVPSSSPLYLRECQCSCGPLNLLLAEHHGRTDRSDSHQQQDRISSLKHPPTSVSTRTLPRRPRAAARLWCG